MSETITAEMRDAVWRELGCPDEIVLELPEGAQEWSPVVFWSALRAALLSDARAVCWRPVLASGGPGLCLTQQGDDCWYAGMIRGPQLVLRRI